jgi:hypothetical protein
LKFAHRVIRVIMSIVVVETPENTYIEGSRRLI